MTRCVRWFLFFRNFKKGKSLASQNPSVKLPDSILVQTLDILGQARTVNKRTNGNSREIPMIPILGKSLEKIQHRIGKIQNRVGNLVTANVGSESVDFTPNRKVKYMYLIYMELVESIITLTRDKRLFSALITPWNLMIQQKSCWKFLNSWMKMMKRFNQDSSLVSFSDPQFMKSIRYLIFTIQSSKMLRTGRFVIL